MKNLIILLHLLLLLSGTSIAQTGPGGVGTTDGTSSLVLWLDANVTSATNTSWPDKSGNSFTMNAGNGATFTSNVQNGNAAYGFNGSSDYFEKSYEAGLNPNTFTIFSADKVITSWAYKTVISSRDDPDGDATAGYILYAKPADPDNWEFWTGDNTGSGAWHYEVTTSNTSTAGNWSGQTMEYQSTTNGKKIYVDGEQKAQSTHPYTANSLRPIRVGAGRNENTADYFYYGDIGEVIMYNVVLNTAQRIIVQNYLSAKWDYALTANNKYVGDDASKGNYDKNVIGIGTESDGSHLESNDGVGLTLSQASGFDNGDYLIAGNWTETNTSNNTDIGGLAGTLEARWQRIWYFDITDASTAMTADITFDFSDASISQTPGVVSNYKLIYRSSITGDWSDAAASITPTKTGDKIKFSGVSLSSDGYYTIGTIDETNSTLPVDLIEFNTKKQDNVIRINWKTATEINNDFFNVERSMDANNWESITQINGAGNSNEILSYNYVDNNPIDGISYYRLKQTDFDGKFEYSNIRKVQQPQKSNLSIYPNPTQNNITIDGYNNDLIDIQIYNSLGKELSSSISYSRISDSSIKMNLSDLAKGVYFIRIDNEMIKVFKN